MWKGRLLVAFSGTDDMADVWSDLESALSKPITLGDTTYDAGSGFIDQCTRHADTFLAKLECERGIHLPAIALADVEIMAKLRPGIAEALASPGAGVTVVGQYAAARGG